MPLLWISIAFIAGTALSLAFSVNWLMAVVSAVILFGLSQYENRLFGRYDRYQEARRRLPLSLLILVGVFLMGMARGQAGKPNFSSFQLGFYNGSADVILRGVASQPPDKHDKSTLLTVSVKDIALDDSKFLPVRGDVMVMLPAGVPYDYGDRLGLIGDLKTPPERDDFSYKQYLENRGVFSYMSYPRVVPMRGEAGNPVMSAIYRLRDRIAVTVEAIIPQPEAGFLAGMLVGRDETIPDDIQEAFKSTGTSHLVAISGFNITLLSGLILTLTNRLFTRRWSVWVAVLLLTGYTLMAGASPSVVRAAIMGGLAIIGRSIGRSRTALNSLGLAAAVMVFFNPLILRDIGFQLSVAATAGILLIGGPLNDRFLARTAGPEKPVEVNRLLAGLGESVLVTLAAQITTLPFLLYHFENYPLIGLLVNPLVLPAQPLAMILGMAAAAVGMIYLPLGKIIGLGAWVLLAYTTRLVDLFSGAANFGLINLHLEWWQAALLGAGLILAVVFQKHWVSNISRLAIPGAYLILGCSLGVLVNSYMLHPDGNLHIEVFRQGTDLSAFITTPGGQRLLLTNRPGDKDLIAFADRRMAISNKLLDALILPNPTATTATGLADSAGRFKPEWIFINREAGGRRVMSSLNNELIGLRESRPYYLNPGRKFDLGRGALLHIGPVDEKGATLEIEWGNTRITFQFGDPSATDVAVVNERNTRDTVIMDHAEQLMDGLTASSFLSVQQANHGGSNWFVVPDGGCLEIFSNGENSEILTVE
ncbi:MAG: ComEC family competence protein [Leptolinea sp.]|nr:ComEC family competence protein [Leptolinea sp.]